MPKRPAAALLVAAILLAAAWSGCTSRRQADPDAHFAAVYAELMLLNEREVIGHTATDSAYRHHVTELLKGQGTTEEGFRQRSEELKRDDRVWKEFLGRVSLVYDSLKSVRAIKPQAPASVPPAPRRARES